MVFGNVQDFLVDVKTGNKPLSLLCVTLSLHHEAEMKLLYNGQGGCLEILQHFTGACLFKIE